MRARSALVTTGLLLFGCSQADPAFEVREAKEIGLVPNAPDIIGRDGGDSAVVWGRSVWLYGDTVLTIDDDVGTNWHSNSASSTTDLDASDGLGDFVEEHEATSGAVAYFLPETDDEARFNSAHRGDPCEETPCGDRWAIWPGAMVFDEERQRALLFYGLVFVGEEALAGGQSLAIWDDPASPPRRPAFHPDSDHPTLLFPEGELPVGAAALIEGDELFAFGCPKDYVSYPCKLAKIALSQVEDPAAWRYWNGDDWTADPAEAETLFDGWVTMSVFFNPHIGAWMTVYSSLFSNDVVARTAPALTGPWSEERLVFTADRKDEDSWTYDALVHPEFTEEDGKVLYMTFTRPNDNGWFGSETPLVRVELE
ncbi:MAG: DUF4185 domain-containing protein [Polyangiaceae bacterium]